MDFGYHLNYISLTVGTRLSPLPYLYTIFITYVTVNCLIITVCAANRIKATQTLKVSLYRYNCRIHYMYYLVEYMFPAVCHTHHHNSHACCLERGMDTHTPPAFHYSKCLLRPPLPHCNRVTFEFTENFRAVVPQ